MGRFFRARLGGRLRADLEPVLDAAGGFGCGTGSVGDEEFGEGFSKAVGDTFETRSYTPGERRCQPVRKVAAEEMGFNREDQQLDDLGEAFGDGLSHT